MTWARCCGCSTRSWRWWGDGPAIIALAVRRKSCGRQSAVIVRNATPADAAAMAALRHASIQQLCSADHNDDPVLIANWIGAPDKFTQLLRQNEVSLFVAVVDGEIAGLCGFKDDLVVLNYVHPQFRLRGVSKAMMQALETRMAALGIVAGRLKSTATALRFYRSIGWIDAGIGSPSEGYPMEKRL